MRVELRPRVRRRRGAGAVLLRCYYYYDAYDRPDPSYDYARRYRAPVYRDDTAEYFANRYRSWDPDTGTYLGYDGYRHPCPYPHAHRPKLTCAISRADLG
jgi:hypothetical protein